MRRGELLALRWRNVDLDGKIVRVRERLEETKTGLRFKGPKFWAGVRDISCLPSCSMCCTSIVWHNWNAASCSGRASLATVPLCFRGGTTLSRSRPTSSPRLGARSGSMSRLRHTHASQLIDAKSPPSPSGSGVARDHASKSRLTCSCDASCAASTAHLRFVLRHVSNGRRPSSVQGPAGCR
jgi:hypothetical protein